MINEASYPSHVADTINEMRLAIDCGAGSVVMIALAKMLLCQQVVQAVSDGVQIVADGMYDETRKPDAFRILPVALRARCLLDVHWSHLADSDEWGIIGDAIVQFDEIACAGLTAFQLVPDAVWSDILEDRAAFDAGESWWGDVWMEIQRIRRESDAWMDAQYREPAFSGWTEER